LRRRLAGLFLLLLAVLGARASYAQSALAVAPESCVYRQGDDVRWAAANLDETAWTTTANWPGDQVRSPFWWMRCRFEPARLAAVVDPVMQVTGNAAYEVYIDGQLAGASGNRKTGRYTMGTVTVWRASAFTLRSGPVVVALRMTLTQQIGDLNPLPIVSLGDKRLQYGEYVQRVDAGVKSRWVTWACHSFIAAAGALFFALYLFNRSQRFLLYISLTWMLLAALRFNELLWFAGSHTPSRLVVLLYAVGQSEDVFLIFFYFSLMGRRMGWLLRLTITLAAIYSVLALTVAVLPVRLSVPLSWAIDSNSWTSSPFLVAMLLSIILSQKAFLPLRSLSREQIPLYITCSFWMLMDTLYLGAQLPGVSTDPGFFLRFQPVRSVAVLLSVIALTLLLIGRLRHGNQQRATLEGEMQAARNIQQHLIPAAVESAPGWRIDAVSLPAREVGGDFYRCTLLAGGRQRLLLGDVSGKGAAAAMTAAMLLGAAAGHEDSSPAELLAHLNRVLHVSGVGGMATCLCALLEPGGRVTLAQAGHLAPYLDGNEVTCESGLPLGLVAEANFQESSIAVPRGGRMMIFSDGVIEARNSSGELFGFDRTRVLSREPAEAIARAAQLFGQDDDITVLTLTRLGNGAEADAPNSATALASA
jgi:sigma-B regulation protein RsbU (phosphoserine phosphatase)